MSVTLVHALTAKLERIPTPGCLQRSPGLQTTIGCANQGVDATLGLALKSVLDRVWRGLMQGIYVMLMVCGVVASSASACVVAADPLAPPPFLYHGTDVLHFDGNWRYPRGPAWLAPNPEFSLHAALRGRKDEPIRLLTYTVRRPLRLAQCDSAAAAEQYAVQRGWLPGSAQRRHDRIIANAFCDGARRPRLDGYRVQADAVRHEAEYILCRPARTLNLRSVEFWPVLTDFSRTPPRRATRGPLGVFMLYSDLSLACFVRLPENRDAPCHTGTKPRLACC